MESPDQENFGEASLGEAQAENPPPDPEMINDDADEGEEPEEAADDQDAGPTAAGEPPDS